LKSHASGACECNITMILAAVTMDALSRYCPVGVFQLLEGWHFKSHSKSNVKCGFI